MTYRTPELFVDGHPVVLLKENDASSIFAVLEDAKDDAASLVAEVFVMASDMGRTTNQRRKAIRNACREAISQRSIRLGVAYVAPAARVRDGVVMPTSRFAAPR